MLISQIDSSSFPDILNLLQPNKEEDDKMRTTAANVAARQAVGGSDMLSKWQLMAEQARQKRAPAPRPSNVSGKGSAEQNEASKRSHFAAFGTGKEAILAPNYFHILMLQR